jgi:DNA-binding MarR family transcriptional regulator
LGLYSSTLEIFPTFPAQWQASIVTGEMYSFRDAKPSKGRRLIEVSPRDLRDAARLLALLLDSSPPAESSRELAEPANKDQLIKLATRMFEARRQRKRFFNPDLFGETAWDMLLVLYMFDERGPRLTIGRLAEFAGCASSSTVRWLSTLETQQLIERESHPNDARASFVRLSDKARKLLELYLSETLSSDT